MRKKEICFTIALFVFCAVLSSCACRHEWVEATCESPKTCAKCEEIEGEPLGHSPTGWKTVKEATVLSAGERVKKCSRCSVQLESTTYSLSKRYEGDSFLFTPSEFLTLLNEELEDVIGYDDVSVVSAESDGYYGCIVKDGSEQVGTIAFLDESEDLIRTSEINKEKVTGVYTSLDYSRGNQGAVVCFCCIAEVCDISLSLSEAKELGTSLVSGIKISADQGLYNKMTKNGIVYSMIYDDATGEFAYIIAPE